jgi:superfamily II DNA or RNA helicase
MIATATAQGSEKPAPSSGIVLPGIRVNGNFRFRKGQELFLQKLAGGFAAGEMFHLGVFVPGYGKTITALSSFVLARAMNIAQKLVVFVPRGNLRDQYANPKELSFVLSSIGAPPMTFCTADSERAFLKNIDTDIIITTYQYASGKGGHAALMKYCQSGNCMFVFDEVHHLSDDGTWAGYITQFPYVCSVALSGTPMRSDNKSLFGVPFEIRNGNERFYKALHEVQLRDAHAEGGILKRVAVHMTDYKIRLRNIDTGHELELSLSQMQQMASGDQDVDAFLARKKMRFHTVYLDELLRPAFQRFAEKRKEWLEEQWTKGSGRNSQNHQMLIIAMSNLHAAAILDFVKQNFPHCISARIGQDVPEEERLDLLDRYRNGLIDVMVQVDMIGEGTDIKPISIIVKADLVRALSKTMQQIFRGMRYYQGFSYEQNICDIYASDDAEVAQILEWIAAEEQIGVKLKQQRQLQEQHSRRPAEQSALWELADVQHKATQTLSWELFPQDDREIKPEQRNSAHAARNKSTAPPAPAITVAVQAMDILAKEQELRQECSSLAAKLALNMQSTGRQADVRIVHSEAKKRFLKSQEQMNLQELQKKRDWLMRCLERGRIV